MNGRTESAGCAEATAPPPLGQRRVAGEDAGPLVLTRYEDVMRALREPGLSLPHPGLLLTMMRMSIDSGAGGLPPDDADAIFLILAAVLLHVDQPAHDRMRRLLRRTLTPTNLPGMRARVRSLAVDLLDGVRDTGRMDVATDFAAPLAARTATTFLGIPLGDLPAWRAWYGALSALLGAEGGDTALRAEARRALHAMRRALRGMIEDRRVRPADDLLSTVATGHEGAVPEDELLALCLRLLFSGRDLTPQFLVAGVHVLLEHPDQYRALREQPALVPAAVEELLRAGDVSNGVQRVAVRDVTIGEAPIGSGRRVLLRLDAANRDPARFPDPRRLDITRHPNAHLTFGHGAHACVGAPLARLQMEAALGALLTHMPVLRLDLAPPDAHGDGTATVRPVRVAW